MKLHNDLDRATYVFQSKENDPNRPVEEEPAEEASAKSTTKASAKSTSSTKEK